MASNKKKKIRTVTLNGVTYNVIESPAPFIAIELPNRKHSLIYLEDLTALGFEWEYDK